MRYLKAVILVSLLVGFSSQLLAEDWVRIKKEVYDELIAQYEILNDLQKQDAKLIAKLKKQLITLKKIREQDEKSLTELKNYLSELKEIIKIEEDKLFAWQLIAAGGYTGLGISLYFNFK